MSLKLVVVFISVFLAAGEEATNRDARSPGKLTGHGHGHITHGHGGRIGLATHGHGFATHGHGFATHGHGATHGHRITHGHGATHGHSYVSTHQHKEPGPPECSKNTTKPWCLEDAEYPLEEITHAASHFINYLLTFYSDVVDLNTAFSVDRPKSLSEETYLCASGTAYVKPLRAVNTDGRWRIIVNNIDLYHSILTQTTRVEECLSSESACPLVPSCYESLCHQKFIIHRFLVYDPLDHHFPFSVETFKLPSTCSCFLGAYTITLH